MPINDRSSDYQTEIINSLKEIKTANFHIKELDYFINQTYRYFSENRKSRIKPEIVVVGTSIPEEIPLATGITPYWILGGSLSMTEYSADYVPRDTDPVSRSILGYIESQKTADFSDSLFIIPANSDSMRKIASQLIAEGRNVYTMDIPPCKDDPDSWNQCNDMMQELCETICAHTGKSFSRKKYSRAADMVYEARLQLGVFLKRTRLYPEILTGTARMLVQNSYYFTRSLSEWTQKLRELNDEVKRLSQTASRESGSHEIYEDTCDLRKIICGKQKNPQVLLLGSPIFFPNMKVPKLIEESGLEICEVIDNSTIKLKKKTFRPARENRKEIIGRIAERWYRNDSSSAFVINRCMLAEFKKAVETVNPSGVICHILKGQIEYDFELMRIEKELEKADIPVFRLETDYKYNDIEQLRIRMEAFSEMLRNRDSLCG